jgi:hypothetical protein
MSIANSFIKRVAPALSTIIGYIRGATAYLTPKDDWVESLKRRLAVPLDKFTRPFGRPLVYEKGRADYFCSAEASPDSIERAIMPRYQRNLTSTRKYRRLSDGSRQWADGSFVYDPDDTDWQHHVYIFPSKHTDGQADLYGHKETSAEKDPYGHVTDEQVHGDPDGITRGKLDEAGIQYA